MTLPQPHLDGPQASNGWDHAKAKLRYLDRIPLYDEVKPYLLRRKGPPGIPPDNLQLRDYHDVPIFDARDHESELALETHGFSFKRCPTQESLDNEESVNRYLDETRDLVSSVFTNSDVRVFDHRFRSSRSQSSQGSSAGNEAVKHRKPSTVVHIDQTPDSAEGRIRHHFPDEAEQLLQKRHLFINVWRPLVERVTDCPLAVCDSRTISDDDLVECDLVYKDYEGEFYVLHHAEAHRWFYLSGQTRDEVILLLNLDSHRDIRCAHTAFFCNEVEGAEPRRSIEVRTVVFLDESV